MQKEKTSSVVLVPRHDFRCRGQRPVAGVGDGQSDVPTRWINVELNSDVVHGPNRLLGGDRIRHQFGDDEDDRVSHVGGQQLGGQQRGRPSSCGTD
ncbi:hypothetical protein RB621_23105 [Streptomyces californicus]|nr:hypothetical protein [Streptomyces californicus]MDW4916330.1 hypothetical protein [Streptomyces californicus]